MLTADEKRQYGILATDIEWPPGSGIWRRPGAVCEARWLGRWPSQGTDSVWSDAAWQAACRPATWKPQLPLLPRIGVDVARKGNDWTAFHMQWAGISLHHERYNGKDPMYTAGRCVELVNRCLALATEITPTGRRPWQPKEVPIIIDQDGAGEAICARLREQGYYANLCGAARTASRPDLYPNMRSELWFSAVAQAEAGLISLARLPKDMLHRLRVQAMAPTWKVDSAGRRVVEPKDETKKRLGENQQMGTGGSPDDMDALNLAYLPLPAVLRVPEVEQPTRRSQSPYDRLRPTRNSAGSKLGRYER